MEDPIAQLPGSVNISMPGAAFIPGEPAAASTSDSVESVWLENRHGEGHTLLEDLRAQRQSAAWVVEAAHKLYEQYRAKGTRRMRLSAASILFVLSLFTLYLRLASPSFDAWAPWQTGLFSGLEIVISLTIVVSFSGCVVCESITRVFAGILQLSCLGSTYFTSDSHPPPLLLPLLLPPHPQHYTVTPAQGDVVVIIGYIAMLLLSMLAVIIDDFQVGELTMAVLLDIMFVLPAAFRLPYKAYSAITAALLVLQPVWLMTSAAVHGNLWIGVLNSLVLMAFAVVTAETWRFQVVESRNNSNTLAAVQGDSFVQLALLERVLPASFVPQLLANERTVSTAAGVAVMFCEVMQRVDVAGHAQWRKLSYDLHESTLQQLSLVLDTLDNIAEAHGVHKVETIQSEFMAVSGLPARARHPACPSYAMICCAQAMLHTMRQRPEFEGLSLQIGINTGVVVETILGRQLLPRWKLFGDTVNTASRMKRHSAPGRIRVSAAVRSQVMTSAASTIRHIDAEAMDQWSALNSGINQTNGLVMMPNMDAQTSPLHRADAIAASQLGFVFQPCAPQAIKGKGMLITYWLAKLPAGSPELRAELEALLHAPEHPLPLSGRANSTLRQHLLAGQTARMMSTMALKIANASSRRHVVPVATVSAPGRTGRRRDSVFQDLPSPGSAQAPRAAGARQDSRQSQQYQQAVMRSLALTRTLAKTSSSKQQVTRVDPARAMATHQSAPTMKTPNMHNSSSATQTCWTEMSVESEEDVALSLDASTSIGSVGEPNSANRSSEQFASAVATRQLQAAVKLRGSLRFSSTQLVDPLGSAQTGLDEPQYSAAAPQSSAAASAHIPKPKLSQWQLKFTEDEGLGAMYLAWAAKAKAGMRVPCALTCAVVAALYSLCYCTSWAMLAAYLCLGGLGVAISLPGFLRCLAQRASPAAARAAAALGLPKPRAGLATADTALYTLCMVVFLLRVVEDLLASSEWQSWLFPSLNYRNAAAHDLRFFHGTASKMLLVMAPMLMLSTRWSDSSRVLLISCIVLLATTGMHPGASAIGTAWLTINTAAMLVLGYVMELRLRHDFYLQHVSSEGQAMTQRMVHAILPTHIAAHLLSASGLDVSDAGMKATDADLPWALLGKLAKRAGRSAKPATQIAPMLDELSLASHSHRRLVSPTAEERVMAQLMSATTQPVALLMFDLVGFTALSAAIGPHSIVSLLDSLYAAFDKLVIARSAYKVETIGDAFLVCAGAPVPCPPSQAALAVVKLGIDMLALLRKFPAPDGWKLQARIGVHIGRVLAGVIGTRLPRYQLFGSEVDYASEMESSGEPGRLHASAAVVELVSQEPDITASEHRADGSAYLRRQKRGIMVRAW